MIFIQLYGKFNKTDITFVGQLFLRSFLWPLFPLEILNYYY